MTVLENISKDLQLESNEECVLGENEGLKKSALAEDISGRKGGAESAPRCGGRGLCAAHR